MSRIQQDNIYTSQAIIDTFTKSNNADSITISNSILIDKYPEQETLLTVDIDSINTEKVIIDSDKVYNSSYTFQRQLKLITTSDNNISISANQGTVHIEPIDPSYGYTPELDIIGENGGDNTGTTSLATLYSDIGKAGTIEIKTRPTCEIRFLYDPALRRDAENFPYKTTHFFTYTVDGGSDEKMAMYEPGAAYYIGTDSQDLPCYFTVSSTGEIGYIGGGENPNPMMNDSGRDYNSIYFRETDSNYWG